MSVAWFQRILMVGCIGNDVVLVQRKLKAPVTAIYDAATAARVRGVQVAHHLPVTGMVDAHTAEFVGESVRVGMVPDWYGRELGYGAEGADVLRLKSLLGVTDKVARFDRFLEATVRRFQSAHHLPLTGRVCVVDATTIGDDVGWRQA